MFTTNVEAMDYIHDLLDTNKSTLGLQSVWYGDESFSAPYPAAVVQGGGLVRDLHATQTFALILQVSVFILHADISVSTRTRTRNDLLLSDAVVALLHTNYTFSGNIVYGFVRSETPGVVNIPRGNSVVSTSIAWAGESRQQFGG